MRCCPVQQQATTSTTWWRQRLLATCPAGAEPLEYEGLRERYLPEVTSRGRVEHRNSQYAVYAVVMYSRAAGERPAAPVDDIARWIAARHGLELTS